MEPVPTTNNMKTLEQQWIEYRDACYPGGLTNQTQHIETRQAFFAGALVVLKLAVERADGLSEEAAYKSIGDLIREAQEVCRQRQYAMKNRN